MKNKKLRSSFKQKPCVICSKKPSDPCHIKSYATTLKDEEINLVAMCRQHHSLQHQKGLVFMWDNFELFKIELQKKGFYVENVFGVRKLFRK